MEWATLKLNFRLKSHTSHNIYSPLDGGGNGFTTTLPPKVFTQRTVWQTLFDW